MFSWRKYRFKAMVWAFCARARCAQLVRQMRTLIYDYAFIGVYERAAAAQRAMPRAPQRVAPHNRDRELEKH